MQANRRLRCLFFTGADRDCNGEIVMDETNDCFEIYLAFHLGLSVAALLRDEQFDVQQHLQPALEFLRGVVADEVTMHDPQAEASRNPLVAAFIAQNAHLVFQQKKQLAERILRGKESQYQVHRIDP
jgi:hypothetical protein